MKDSTFIVDGLVVLLAVWYRDGHGSSTFLKKGQELDKEAVKIAESMLEYLDFLPGGSHTWVFDGPNVESPKLRKARVAKRRATKIRHGIWLYFLSGKYNHKRLGLDMWRRNAPPRPGMIRLILKKLVKTGRAKVHVARGEADFAIAAMVRQSPVPIVIVSSDSDFLAFTRCLAVLNPVRS